MAGEGHGGTPAEDEGGQSGDLGEGWAHKFICPRCQADSSRPEDTFVLHAGVVVPRSDYVLMESERRAFGPFRDVAFSCGASERAVGEQQPHLSVQGGRTVPMVGIHPAADLQGVLAC